MSRLYNQFVLPLIGGIALIAAPSCDLSQKKDLSKIPLSDIQWRDVGPIYGSDSNKTELQKDQAWARFEGKKVRWSGEVGDVETMFGVLSINVIMPKYSGNPILDSIKSTDVYVFLQDDQDLKASNYSPGSRITFEGILSDWSDLDNTVTVDDAIIIE